MSWYRNVVWFVKGLREYTRSGYESASKHFDPADLEVDVAGRSFLITGSNSGIGKAAAREIARRGGTVHLVCRNKERAEDAKGEIVTETGNQNIFLHIVDISNPKEIWKFAEKFKTEHKLNVLINNAGCMVNNRELTENGLEKNFATNTLDKNSAMCKDAVHLERSRVKQIQQFEHESMYLCSFKHWGNELVGSCVSTSLESDFITQVEAASSAFPAVNQPH